MNSNICNFCDESDGIYVCPRCNVPFCSVACYRSPQHTNCSEAFYKECIEEEMKVREPDPQVQKTMMEILKRGYNENGLSESDDSDDEVSLEERLKGINLDETEEVWSKLTPEEQQEFLELANKGDISKLVPMWDPWWTKTHRKPKVRFSDDSDNHDSYKSLCPHVTSIPPLSNLSKTNPSPLVFNNLLNVVAAYVMTTRFLNGEHINAPDEASSFLLDLSKNLSSNVVFDTLDLAIESVTTEAISNPIIAASTENVTQMKTDTAKISLGPNEEESSFYVLSALSNIVSLFKCSIKSPKQYSLNETYKTTLPGVFGKKLTCKYTKKQFMMAEKKIQYYLSWVDAYYSGIINEYKQGLSS